MPPDAPTRSGRWDTVARLYLVGLRRLYEQQKKPVTGECGCMAEPCESGPVVSPPIAGRSSSFHVGPCS